MAEARSNTGNKGEIQPSICFFSRFYLRWKYFFAQPENVKGNSLIWKVCFDLFFFADV